MKFDLEKAKLGHPVQLRNGREARIICFDKKGSYPIVVLFQGICSRTIEDIRTYTIEGKPETEEHKNNDLVMKTVVKTRWVLVPRKWPRYETEGEAIDAKNEPEALGLIAVPVETEELECAAKNH